jgi:hypothetical protein
MKSFVIVFVVSLVGVAAAPSASAAVDCSRYGMSSNGVGGCTRSHFGGCPASEENCFSSARVISVNPKTKSIIVTANRKKVILKAATFKGRLPKVGATIDIVYYRVGRELRVANVHDSASRANTGPSPHGTFTASSGCLGIENIVFTLKNLDQNTSILVHEKSWVILDQSFQVIHQPTPGPLKIVGPQLQPPNIVQWTWDQKTTSNTQAPVGTYTVVLAVEDDMYDPFVDSDTDPWIYVATFKINVGSPTTC